MEGQWSEGMEGDVTSGVTEAGLRVGLSQLRGYNYIWLRWGSQGYG